MPRDIWLPIPVEAVADRSVSLALRRKSGNHRPQRTRRRHTAKTSESWFIAWRRGFKANGPGVVHGRVAFRGPTGHAVRDVVDNTRVPLDFGSDRTFGGPMGPAVSRIRKFSK